MIDYLYWKLYNSFHGGLSGFVAIKFWVWTNITSYKDVRRDQLKLMYKVLTVTDPWIIDDDIYFRYDGIGNIFQHSLVVF